MSEWIEPDWVHDDEPDEEVEECDEDDFIEPDEVRADAGPEVPSYFDRVDAYGWDR